MFVTDGWTFLGRPPASKRHGVGSGPGRGTDALKRGRLRPQPTAGPEHAGASRDRQLKGWGCSGFPCGDAVVAAQAGRHERCRSGGHATREQRPRAAAGAGTRRVQAGRQAGGRRRQAGAAPALPSPLHDLGELRSQGEVGLGVVAGRREGRRRCEEGEGRDAGRRGGPQLDRRFSLGTPGRAGGRQQGPVQVPAGVRKRGARAAG